MGADRAERKGVKAGIDKEDCRKNRAAQKVELRKAKRDEGLQKRRNLEVVNVEIEEPTTPGQSASDDCFATLVTTTLGFVQRNGPPEEYDDALVACRQLRKQLSLAKNPPIDEVINGGLVPAFVTMLAHPESKMQFEAAWCLTNIASGTSTQGEAVVANNGVPALIALLDSPSLEVCEQAVWALGNIAGDCPALRDLVLNNGATEKIIKMIEATASMGQMSQLRNAVWALSNLMRGKPQPAINFVATCVPVLARLLMINDDEVMMDTCWALSYVSDGGDDRIDMVVAQGCIQPLMTILRERQETRTRTPALRTLCNVLTGSHEATQAVVDAGILQVLPDFIKSPKAQTRKEACWAISNIAAGTNAQVDEVMRSPLLAAVVERLANDEYDIKKEAAWVIANILHGFASDGSMAQASRAQTLAQLGAIPPIVNMLEVNDPAMQKLMLEAVGTMLSAGEVIAKAKGSDNPFLVPLDEAEGVDKLEALQEHSNEEIYQKAVELLEKYFGEDGDEDENLLPNTAAQGFTFGTTPLAANNNFNFGSPAQAGFAF